MTKTLSDKIIMMVLTLLFTAGEVFASGSFEIGIPTVVPVISAALVYGLSEVLNNKIFVFISAAASVALTFFFPEYWVLLPAAVYAAATLEDFNLYIRIAIIAVSTAASFATGIPGVFKVLVLIIVACFTAYKTNAYIASEKKLIGTFDKAREDLIREQERNSASPPHIAISFTVPHTASFPISEPGKKSGFTTKLSVEKTIRSAPGRTAPSPSSER